MKTNFDWLLTLRPFIRRFKTNFSGIQDLYAPGMMIRFGEIGHWQLKKLDD